MQASDKQMLPAAPARSSIEAFVSEATDAENQWLHHDVVASLQTICEAVGDYNQPDAQQRQRKASASVEDSESSSDT